MPKSVFRVALAASALVAVIVMAGVCAGAAGADPDEAGSDNTVDAGPAFEAPPISEPQPTTSDPPSIFDVPETLPQIVPGIVPGLVPGAVPAIVAEPLRDAGGRPLSVFGNGRVPGTHTVPGGRKRTAHEHPAPVVTGRPAAPARIGTRPWEPRRVPARTSASVVDVTLPFAGPFSIPVPDLPVPGYEIMRWTLDLTNPSTTYASLRATAATVNALLVDALALHAPGRPVPAFRTFVEEPVVDAGGTVSDGSPQLPVAQLPLLVPAMRIAPDAPVRGAIPAGAGARVVTEPSGAVARTAATTDLAPPATAATPNGPAPTRPEAVGSALREGTPRYREVIRPYRVAMIAVPGLVGLLVITASGGVIGYRQANSGRYLRSEAMRFLA